MPFTCKDCGKQEVWTAGQQKWWHEQMGGDVETTAVRCRNCRAKERARKAEVNRVREEGLERKRREQGKG
ncbi:zinc-ribbon domain containing protein [Luteolibacter luteus]|uniref:zinc-ribbon domain containing protein n=1 Tax=Luteolibacter luteus TaxID=2728835 RepID=UPI0031BAA6BE